MRADQIAEHRKTQLDQARAELDLARVAAKPGASVTEAKDESYSRGYSRGTAELARVAAQRDKFSADCKAWLEWRRAYSTTGDPVRLDAANEVLRSRGLWPEVKG